MKLRDLFADYYVSEELHIVTIPGTQIYYAIRNAGEITDRDAIYKLTESQVEDILDNKLPAEELYNDHFGWVLLDTYESDFPPKLLERLSK